MRDLVDRIRRREARCGVIGLGYVGLPLALEFARAGLRVTGIDLDERKIADIRAGRTYIVDVSGAEIAATSMVVNRLSQAAPRKVGPPCHSTSKPVMKCRQVKLMSPRPISWTKPPTRMMPWIALAPVQERAECAATPGTRTSTRSVPLHPPSRPADVG